MSLQVLFAPDSSTPICELELTTTFAFTPSDAETFWELVDGDIVDAEWANANVRGRLYSALRAAYCGKHVVDDIAHFTFADGSEITTSCYGIQH